MTKITKARFDAKHENGAVWQLVAKPEMAANFVRNYCRKHRAPGVVTLTNVATGLSTKVSVDADYTI